MNGPDRIQFIEHVYYRCGVGHTSPQLNDMTAIERRAWRLEHIDCETEKGAIVEVVRERIPL